MTTNFIHVPFTDYSAYVNALSAHAANAVKTRGRHLDRNAVARFPIFAKAYARKIVTPDLWEGLDGNAKAQEFIASAYFLDHLEYLGEITTIIANATFATLYRRAIEEIFLAEHGIDSEEWSNFLASAIAHAHKRLDDFIPHFDADTLALVERDNLVERFRDRVEYTAPEFLSVEAWEACRDDEESLAEFREALFLYIFEDMFEAFEVAPADEPSAPEPQPTPTEPTPARTKGKKTTSRR